MIKLNKIKLSLYIIFFLFLIIGLIYFNSEVKRSIEIMEKCSGLIECLHRSLVSIMILMKAIFTLLFFTLILLILFLIIEKID